jgi:hypothetical protein
VFNERRWTLAFSYLLQLGRFSVKIDKLVDEFPFADLAFRDP